MAEKKINFLNNICDSFGKFINETYINTAELRRQLQGFHVVDTPLSKLGYDSYTTNTATRKQQLDKQVHWNLITRNNTFDRIKTIARHHIAVTIKDIIISDGFNEVNNANNLFIKYTDPDDAGKSELFTEEINKMIRRTGFLDILRDCIYSEGLDYGEIFLSKKMENGKGIIDIVDDIDLREHVAIYSKSNFIGAVRLNPKSKGRVLDGDFIPASEISHFMLNYRREPLEITVGKSFEKMNTIIKEKIRTAVPILEPVVDLIKQYNQLEQISTAIEISRAIQPILLGVGVSPDQDMEKLASELQNWSNALNKNKNSIINNLDSLDINTLLQNMQTIELIPYDTENNANAMRQIVIDYGETNLADKINNVRKTIALAVGIPEQYISTSGNMGQKDSKEDTIQTNPRYSMMLSRIQQLLAKGIREVAYSHLKARFSNDDGVLKRSVDREKIEVIFKSCTNLNDRLENENMMVKAEMMASLVNVVDSVAGSPNMEAKVASKIFIEMWREQFRNNPLVRDIFSLQTPAEVDQKRADLELPDRNTQNTPKVQIPVQQPVQDPKQKARDIKSDATAKQRKRDKAENDGDDEIRASFG